MNKQFYLPSKTKEFIHHCIKYLDYKYLDYMNFENLDNLQKILFDLDKLSYEKLNREDAYKRYTLHRNYAMHPHSYPNYLVNSNCIIFDQIIDEIEIDDRNSISLVNSQYIVAPHKILNLLCHISIPKTNNGLVIENHYNLGYHFHYGNITKSGLERSTMLLTFDPNSFDPKKEKEKKEDIYTLYSEYHSEGKSKEISIEAIGKSRRKKIYKECYKIGIKRKISNFRSLSNDSTEFYPI